MQKANPRKLRANLKTYLQSNQATVIKDAHTHDPKLRALLIPIHQGNNPWTKAAKNHAMAQAKKLFTSAMKELNTQAGHTENHPAQEKGGRTPGLFERPPVSNKSQVARRSSVTAKTHHVLSRAPARTCARIACPVLHGVLPSLKGEREDAMQNQNEAGKNNPGTQVQIGWERTGEPMMLTVTDDLRATWDEMQQENERSLE